MWITCKLGSALPQYWLSLAWDFNKFHRLYKATICVKIRSVVSGKQVPWHSPSMHTDVPHESGMCTWNTVQSMCYQLVSMVKTLPWGGGELKGNLLMWCTIFNSLFLFDQAKNNVIWLYKVVTLPHVNLFTINTSFLDGLQNRKKRVVNRTFKLMCISSIYFSSL